MIGQLLPKWLTGDFTATTDKINIGGTLMTLFKKSVAKDAGITLGGNVNAAVNPPGTMYVVFAVPKK